MPPVDWHLTVNGRAVDRQTVKIALFIEKLNVRVGCTNSQPMHVVVFGVCAEHSAPWSASQYLLSVQDPREQAWGDRWPQQLEPEDR